MGDPTPVSPNEDLCLYGEQMLGMVKILDIDVATSGKKPKYKILNHLYSDSLAFPFLQGLAVRMSHVQEKPYSILATLHKG